ncbi:hypothetical protein DFP72DRAFT_782162, partial [Ephemerocybe angulata]
LNTQQVIAYRIITDHFLRRFVMRDETVLPLRMLLTGPGGTGKTYVVNTVKKVMKAYRCDHTIRYLAPTGSAAALIDGMTIHKGLGLKIENSNAKGKGNRNPGAQEEDFSVLKHVDILFVDEVSLLSSQLLCEIDYAL